MKFQLMIQSLSPLALLTIIRNFSFIVFDDKGKKLSFTNFIFTNIVLLIVMLVCLIWIVLSLYYLIRFGAFKWTDKEDGYTIFKVEENEDASLNFFLTLIIPLLLDDVATIQGALTFFIIVLLMCTLLSKTSLFYANPILAILGYRVYEFSFEANKNCEEEKYIGICRTKLTNGQSVEYKEITEKVIYLRGK